MAAGQEATPGDMKASERLKRYWSKGEGNAKYIQFGTPGDFGRCVKALMQHANMSKDNAEGYCYNRHVEALGYSPQEHAKMERGEKG